MVWEVARLDLGKKFILGAFLWQSTFLMPICSMTDQTANLITYLSVNFWVTEEVELVSMYKHPIL